MGNLFTGRSRSKAQFWKTSARVWERIANDAAKNGETAEHAAALVRREEALEKVAAYETSPFLALVSVALAAAFLALPNNR